MGVVRLKSEPAPSLDPVAKVQGELVHSFPAALKQVRLIAVLGDAAPRRRQSVAGEDLPTFADPGRLPVMAFEANIAGEWALGFHWISAKTIMPKVGRDWMTGSRNEVGA